MRLSWNEIRARAARFADEWRDAAYEKGETQSFYNEFFEIFGVRRRSVARYEEHVKKLDNRFRVHRPVLAGRPDRRAEERRARSRSRLRAGRGVFRQPAREGPPALYPGQRLPELRASRSGRGRADLCRPGGPTLPCRGVRLHPGGATPNLPRSGPGQRRSLGVDGTAA